MGLIVNDVIALKIGISKPQCYINIGLEPIVINKKNKTEYIISVTFGIYYDIDSYQQGGLAIDKKKLSIIIDKNEINQNLYILLYERLKPEYSSYINT